jgi:arylsulfatase A-like enzyme
MKKWILVCAALTALGAQASRKPNVVYILTDQWRAQAFGYAGDPNVKTPAIDQLAAEGVNFKNAVSVAPICTPHRAALLTGRFPTTTGMIMNDIYLPSGELCMAEIFKEAGYHTGYIGKWHLDAHGRSSYIPPERRQGFDYWKVLECTHNYNDSKYYDNNNPNIKTWKGYDAYAQTDDACAYIKDKATAEEPFLLFLSLGGPHFPHGSAPKNFKALYPVDQIKLRPNVPKNQQAQARREAQGYYAHCTAIDTCIPKIKEAISDAGIEDNTILIFTSDHGEMLGSHNMRPFTKHVPWDESVCIPFLLSYPPLTGSKGRVIETPINTPDILPTLLGLAGIPLPDTFDGEDLSELIRTPGKEIEGRVALVVQVVHDGLGRQVPLYRALRTSRYTYARSLKGPWLLYDNQNDPYQTNNLVGNIEHKELAERLDAQLLAKLAKNRDAFKSGEEHIADWGLEKFTPYEGHSENLFYSPKTQIAE